MLSRLAAVCFAFFGSITCVVHARQITSNVSTSTLDLYTACKYSGDLTAISVDRMTRAPIFRPVKTATGTKYVSVADAYRVMLAYPDTDYFVNLKIEQSVQGKFAEDKKSIIEEMQGMSTDSSRMQKLEHSVTSDISVYGVNHSSLDTGGVISIYTFFDDRKEVVVTAYLLNAEPEHRAFDSMARYLELRDRFASDVVSCMAMIRG